MKKSWKTLMSAEPEPSAPWVLEASMAMRHVVMESAMGMTMEAAPVSSVTISGLM